MTSVHEWDWTIKHIVQNFKNDLIHFYCSIARRQHKVVQYFTKQLISISFLTKLPPLTTRLENDLRFGTPTELLSHNLFIKP